jgi:hypothetical protein
MAAVAAVALLDPMQAGAQKRPAVMVVGSIHMANPGADFANMTMDDITSEKRQREVADLVNRLSSFGPTKIALEYAPSQDSAVNAGYLAFRNNSRALQKTEREQVGFRLAAQLGHPRVYGIDAPMALDVGAVMQFAMANGMQDFAMETQRTIQQVMSEAQQQAQTLPITGLMAAFNNPQREQLMNSFYLRATQVSRDTNYVGAAMAADWYERNLRMLSNLHRVVTSESDRVLLVVGAAHAAILRSMIRDAGLWELVDPLPLLSR